VSALEDGLLTYGPELVSSLEDGLLLYGPELVSSLEGGLLPYGPEPVSSRLLSRNVMIKACGSIIFPDMLCRCETCSVVLQEERKQRNFMLFISVRYCHSV
jgi:hypothetical protein